MRLSGSTFCTDRLRPHYKSFEMIPLCIMTSDKYFPARQYSKELQSTLLPDPGTARQGRCAAGIGSELQRVALDDLKHPHRLASEAEILELMPELEPPG
jgi:hypothetical protein